MKPAGRMVNYREESFLRSGVDASFDLEALKNSFSPLFGHAVVLHDPKATTSYDMQEVVSREGLLNALNRCKQSDTACALHVIPNGQVRFARLCDALEEGGTQPPREEIGASTFATAPTYFQPMYAESKVKPPSTPEADGRAAIRERLAQGL